MTDLLDTHAGDWSARLNELVDALDVPGAALGVTHRGVRIIATAGICGLRNRAPVTVDTAFQVGSISKLYTATLLMQVAGPEILRRPVVELLPEAAWIGPEVRVVHLLTHSSGLGGDWFADTGRGDDCLARYVAQLAAQPRDVPGPPGIHYSYCNSGYAVLGRLIEVLAGDRASYDELLRTRLLAPLHAHATSTLPEQAILGSVALGHNRHDGGPLTADARWNFSRACGPLGGICATAGDVLSFAELHLRDGHGPDDSQILDPETVRLMRRRHHETPPLARPGARGLGFGIFEYSGAELPGHDGQTLGQESTLRLAPEHELAVVVLANAIPDGDALTRAMEDAVLEPFGLTRPSLPAPVADPGFDPTPYAGEYRNLVGSAAVSGEPGGLQLVMRYRTEGLEEENETVHLAPLGDDAFVDARADPPTRAVRFSDRGPDGRCRAYDNGRIARRVTAS